MAAVETSVAPMAGQVDTGASGGGEAPGAADGAVSGASGAAGIGHGDATMVDASADGDPGGAAPAEHSTEATEPQPMDTSAAPLPGDPHDAALARDQSADRGTATSGVDSTDDDPVVQECDVYLNRMYDPPDFVGDMYVLQYPLRPVYRPYGDQGELDRVELKPRSRRLKFVYKLSTGDNFDEDGVATERHGQKHVLSSTVVANPNCSYAVGVIHQGRMTITPIRAVNQLRPDFETFDRLRAQQHSRAASAASADPVAEAMAEAAPAAACAAAVPSRSAQVGAGMPGLGCRALTERLEATLQLPAAHLPCGPSPVARDSSVPALRPALLARGPLSDSRALQPGTPGGASMSPGMRPPDHDLRPGDCIPPASDLLVRGVQHST
mmetsp:Transcript_29011/g.92521  ORF Transcript_29011/g.92521 Transcript_29011/m.92521 type:complete len:382 (+) Transcript_29011:232-1377(+)